MKLVFSDEIGDNLAEKMATMPYVWQQRLQQMSNDNRVRWFDNNATTGIEQRDDIIIQAAKKTLQELTELYQTPDASQWLWGDYHKITFSSPVIPGKLADIIFGAGTHSLGGSGETLMRGLYPATNFPNENFKVTAHAAARLAIDLGDKEKIHIVLSGGASGRQFNKHLDDHIDNWLEGKLVPVWMTPELAKLHAISTLTLLP